MEEGEISTSDVAKWLLRIFIGGLLIGFIILGWVNVLGPLFNQANYNNFNNSPEHLNAVAGRFSTDCEQLATTTDTTSRKAIEEDIYQNASTVDLNQVQMPDTTRACVAHAIQAVTH